MCFVKFSLGLRWKCCCIRSGTQVDALTALDDTNESEAPSTRGKRSIFGKWMGSLSGGGYVVKSENDENTQVTGVGIGGKVRGHASGSATGDVAIFEEGKLAPKATLMTTIDDDVTTQASGFVGTVGRDEVEAITIPSSEDISLCDRTNNANSNKST